MIDAFLGAGARYMAAVLLALVAVSVPAHAEAPQTRLDLSVAPGGVDEHCLRIDAAQLVLYSFEADAVVDFNIHAHRGNDVIYPVRRAAIRQIEAGRFQPTATDDYCLMWENRGTIAVRISGRVWRQP